MRNLFAIVITVTLSASQISTASSPPTPVLEAPQAVRNVYIYPGATDPLIFGRGYDSTSAEFRGACVAPEPVSVIGDGGTGMDTSFSLEQVSTSEQLRRVTEAEISASARWGIRRASATMSALKQSEFNSHDVYLVLRVAVRKNALALTKPKLLPESLEVWQRDRAAFREACGNTFIASMVVGGDFTAIYRVSTTSASDRLDLSARLSGSFSGIDGAANFKKEIESIRTSHSVMVQILREGPSGSLPSLDPKSLIDYALAFPSLISGAQNSRPYEAQAQSYATLLEPLPDGEETSKLERYLRHLADEVERALQDRNDLQFAMKNLNQFHEIKRAAVQSRITELERYIEQATNYARSCIEDPSLCGKFEGKRPEMLPLQRYDRIIKHDQDMKEKLTLDLPPGLQCSLQSAEGKWSRWLTGDGWEACSGVEISINPATNFATSDHDTPLDDNRGVCTFTFVCLYPE